MPFIDIIVTLSMYATLPEDDGTPYGIMYDISGRYLLVSHIARHGLAFMHNKSVKRWNRIQAGDRILSINGVTGGIEMDYEIYRSTEIKLQVRRYFEESEDEE